MRYVYMLKVGESHYKVGIAKEVVQRVKELQTSNPNVIEIVTTKIVEDEYKTEGQIHEYLQQMRADGGREWFTLTPEQAIALAILINKIPSVDLTQQITLRSILSKQDKQQAMIVSKLDIVAGKLKNVPLDRESMEIIRKSKQPEPESPFANDDTVYQDAKLVVMQAGKASTSLLQRKLKIGYGRASRTIEQLEEEGIIGPADGARARVVYTEAIIKQEQTNAL